MKYGQGEIEIIRGDITDQEVDAIVNASNNDLILGSGVAGAIRRKGGPSIQEECDRHGPIKVGEAALTGGGNLKAKHVIHAASMGAGRPTTAETLLSSTKASLIIARDNGFESVAFPALGTGVSGFPIDKCTQIMIQVTKDHLRKNTSPKKVTFVLWDKDAYDVFQSLIKKGDAI